jgi:MFS family permease
MPESVPSETATGPVDEDAGRLVAASRSRLFIVLALLVLFTEIVPLQVQMVSLVLPKMGAAFPAAGANISWSITILTITGAATMALVGKAGDVIGKKRVLLILGLLAAIGTLICALTSDWALFLVGRGITGVCLGIAVVNLALIRDLFPRRWIPIAVGLVGTGFAVSSILGPLVTGLLTNYYSWRSAYWFLLVFTVVMIPLLAVFVPESPLRARRRFDVPGALLLGAGVGGVLVYLSEGTTWGWGNAAGLGYLIGGMAALAACVAWELRAAAPTLDFPLLRQPRVLLVMIVQLLITGTQTIVPLLVAYLFETPSQARLQQEAVAGFAANEHLSASVAVHLVHFQGSVSGSGYSVFQVAWHISIPMAVFTVISAPLGGWLARRIGARTPLIAGTIVMAAACGLWIGWHSTWQDQVAIGILWGIGSGFDFAAWPNLIIDVVPADKQGISGGMVQVFGGIGAAAATALITTVLAAHPFRMVIAVPGGHSVTTAVPQVYTDSGFSLGYLLIGVIPVVIALALSLMLSSGRAPARGGAAAEAPGESATPAGAR